MINEFKSWVPNVTSQLSFSAIGNTKHPSISVCTNFSDGENRFIVVHQARDTLDMMLPVRTKLANLLGYDGKMWFACVANSYPKDQDKQASLEGHLFIFHNKSMWKESAKGAIKTLRNTISETEQTNEQKVEYIKKLLIDQSDILIKSSSFFAKFSLKRNGEVTITHNDEIKISDKAPELPSINDLGKRKQIIQELSSQLFFFLKDISHEHQHHSPTTDTIIDLHVTHDDNPWQSYVLYALYRKIIRYKRNRTPDAIVNSQGTLAYAKAFKAICTHNDIPIPHYCDTSLEDSLEAAKNGIILNQTENERKLDSTRNWLISILGLVFTYASLLQLSNVKIPITANHWLISIATFVIEQPLIIIVSVAAFIFHSLYNTNKFRLIRNISKLFHALKRNLSVTFILFVALCTFVLTLLITFSWLPNL